MTGNDLFDATACTLLLAALIAFVFQIKRLRTKPTLTRGQICFLAIAGILLSLIAGFLWFLASLALAIMNTPKWPYSNEGAPAWVDPLGYQAIPVGTLISILCLILLWRFLKRRTSSIQKPS